MFAADGLTAVAHNIAVNTEANLSSLNNDDSFSHEQHQDQRYHELETKMQYFKAKIGWSDVLQFSL